MKTILLVIFFCCNYVHCSNIYTETILPLEVEAETALPITNKNNVAKHWPIPALMPNNIEQTTTNHGNNVDSSASATDEDLTVLANPNYNPSLYEQFIPQAAVQEYVNSYGGSYYPSNPIFGYNVLAPTPWVISPPHPPLPPPMPYYPNAPVFVRSSDNQYDILLPSDSATQSERETRHTTTMNSNSFSTLRRLLTWPFEIISMFNNLGTVILALLGVFIFSDSILSSFCAYVPICSINIPLDLGETGVVQQQPSRVYIESLNSTEKALQRAINKYK